MLIFRAPALVCLLMISGCENSDSSSHLSRIAHAGGGYKNWVYTNSLEALNFNRDHFEIFEIDLAWTADGQLVCLHDWQHNAEWIFQRDFTSRPTLAEFEQLVEENPYAKNCTLETLAQWLKNNPKKRVIPDLKEEVIKGLTLISEQFPLAGDQMIAQIYTPEQYFSARSLGYHDIIWTLYQMPPMPLEDLIEQAQDMELYALAMPRRLAERGDGHKWRSAGFSTYVHTINTQRELDGYQALGVDEIYTDWLAP